MNISLLYEAFLKNPSICTDTRKLKSGDIFFALKGPNFNGNQFIQLALDAGASLCIADEALNDVQNERLILVDDALQTLQELAHHHRNQFNIPIIAVTGSNGKTTTKELMHAVLSSHYITYTTKGNLNNHIGIPLTLLKIKQDAQMAIVEMGANHLGEIADYCRYTAPTHGLITNCGKAHLEGFGGLEGVRKGKGELFDYLRTHQQTAFVNAAFDYLVEMSKGIHNIVHYGKGQTQFYGEAQNGNEMLCVKMYDGSSIQTQLVGDYNVHNVLAAYAVGITFGVLEEKIIKALENYEPGNHRSQLVHWKNNTVILDAYNANPSSMKVAIENFAAMPADKKVLALGSMKEMGADSDAEHQALLNLIAGHHWYAVMLVGEEFTQVPSGMRHFANSQEAGKWLQEQGYNGVHILVKGSRGTQMEKVLVV